MNTFIKTESSGPLSNGIARSGAAIRSKIYLMYIQTPQYKTLVRRVLLNGVLTRCAENSKDVRVSSAERR